MYSEVAWVKRHINSLYSRKNRHFSIRTPKQDLNASELVRMVSLSEGCLWEQWGNSIWWRMSWPTSFQVQSVLYQQHRFSRPDPNIWFWSLKPYTDWELHISDSSSYCKASMCGRKNSKGRPICKKTDSVALKIKLSSDSFSELSERITLSGYSLNPTRTRVQP